MIEEEVSRRRASLKKLYLYILVFWFIVVNLGGCVSKNDVQDERIEKITINSSILGKDMISQVYLPENYDSNIKYPVLYFLPSNGGSSYTVINQFGIVETVDRMTQNNQIAPMIIVALGIDNSFGINSGAETREITRSLSLEDSDVRINEGMYEDYIIYEAIPYIDEHFSTDASRNGRYIGGYSMGGFAALYLAFNHPDMFSKVGGHSPSLFKEEYIAESDDTSWLKWIYPDEEARIKRDPVLLAEANDLSGLSVYLDTGETDVNIDGCERLYEVLTDKQVEVEFNLFPGIHGFAYCKSHMEKYMLFYGGE